MDARGTQSVSAFGNSNRLANPAGLIVRCAMWVVGQKDEERDDGMTDVVCGRAKVLGLRVLLWWDVGSRFEGWRGVGCGT